MTATNNPDAGTEIAVLGGGCFWCLDAVFRGLAGVVSVESGYAGGANADPTYEDVCSGRTGHAEVVRVEFDPAVLSFRDLLNISSPSMIRRRTIGKVAMSARSTAR